MRAAVIPKLADPWEIRDVPTPEPGPDEVLIRVQASGLCHNDLYVAGGTFPVPPMDPMITGHEPVGEIVALGEGVTVREVGDRVGGTWVQGTCGRCDYCRRNFSLTGQSGMECEQPVMTGITTQGGHAEYVTVQAGSTVLLPDGLDYELAAPVFCAGYTAWSAIRAGAPQPHERVAVLGIGGLGHMALQYSRASGHETIAITRSPDKHDLARQLGASEVVADGAELSAIGGADVIVVTGTSYPAAQDALQGLRVNGRLVLATIDPSGAFTLDAGTPVWSKRQSIIGSTHNGLDLLTEALDMVAGGQVKPMAEAYPAEKVNDALRRMTDGDVRFRAVLTW